MLADGGTTRGAGPMSDYARTRKTYVQAGMRASSPKAPPLAQPGPEECAHFTAQGVAVSPSRANRSSSPSSGLAVSLSEALSVREDPLQNLAFQLAFLVLAQRAHANVPDPLSATGASNTHPVR
jgi:hypothetical protein